MGQQRNRLLWAIAVSLCLTLASVITVVNLHPVLDGTGPDIPKRVSIPRDLPMNGDRLSMADDSSFHSSYQYDGEK